MPSGILLLDKPHGLSSNAAHSCGAYIAKHASSALVSTTRRSPDALRASLYRAGMLVRPFPSIVCS